MKETITDEKIMENLTKEEKSEYQRLKWIENLAKVLWKEVPKNVKKGLEQYEEKEGLKNEWPKEEPALDFEVPQNLQSFRELWKEKIHGIDDEIKENIIKASKQIPVKVEKDAEGNKLIEFSLNWKKYRILDANLEMHSDWQYYKESSYESTIYKVISSEWMIWNEIENWENEELREFVKEQESKWWHMPTMEEMKNLARELWILVKAKNRGDGIAMLMYLTGMNWWYRLSSIFWEKSRCKLICNANSRNIDFFDTESYAGLCMMA